MKKAAVFLYQDFSEYELSVALTVLQQGGVKTEFVGLSERPVTGEAGLKVLPDRAITDLNMTSLNALVLPWCSDIGPLKNEKELFSLIRNAADADIFIAAICSAPFLLAKAGVLDERYYTVGFTKEQRAFTGAFDEEYFTDAGVVTADNILTAKGAYFIDFGLKLGDLLGLKINKSWYRK